MIDSAILCTIRAVAQAHDKSYSIPSQQTILALLSRYHNVVICRRTLNYRLRRLVQSGYLNRIVRHTITPQGLKVFRSTAYYILPKAHNLMKTVANLASRFFSGFRVQSVAHNIKEKLICNTDKGNRITIPAILHGLPDEIRSRLERLRQKMRC